MRSARALLAAASLLAALPAASPAVERTEERAPCAEQTPLRRVFFGDLHVHTAFSQDASTQGTRNRPRDAYRFARGEALGIQPYDAEGHALRHLQLARPLDFAAVTDHAELLGETETCSDPGRPGYDSWICRIGRRWPRMAFFLMNTRTAGGWSRFGFCGADGAHCLDAALVPWGEIQDAAEEAYDRTSACGFTSFVGYEWTGAADFYNLHRNVIFRNAEVPRWPASFYEAKTAPELWTLLERDCLDSDGRCDALVIPHNSNLSGGRMYPPHLPGAPPPGDPAALRRQQLREPLIEVMQHKGDSECWPGAPGAARDELCAFEKLPYDGFTGKFVPWLAGEIAPLDFVREILKQGLLVEERSGVNPYQIGLLASTDTHLGTPGAVSEDDFPGHGGAGKPARDAVPVGLPDELEFNPGGLVAIWAEENSRDALFEALRRREVYGTSGPRIRVRLFAGWGLASDLCARGDFAEQGYATGVPMGSFLGERPPGADAPRLAVRALRDPGSEGRPGTPLQRIQIVKGWVEDETTHERVIDVVGDTSGQASVDLDTCEPKGPAADQLCSVWSDPDFDPAERAFYYARVVENPTCRWSQRLCRAAKVDCSDSATVTEGFEPCCSPQHRPVIQERAWTSPVWYQPETTTRENRSPAATR